MNNDKDQQQEEPDEEFEQWRKDCVPYLTPDEASDLWFGFLNQPKITQPEKTEKQND